MRRRLGKPPELLRRHAAFGRRAARAVVDDEDVAGVGTIGAEVGGIDLREPLTTSQVSAIRQALLDWKVLFFRDQDIDTDQHLAFSRNFGDPTFALTGAVLSGDDPSGLTQGQVMVGSTIGGVTTVYIGTNGAPGGDLTIQLQGSFAAADFHFNNHD